MLPIRMDELSALKAMIFVVCAGTGSLFQTILYYVVCSETNLSHNVHILKPHLGFALGWDILLQL